MKLGNIFDDAKEKLKQYNPIHLFFQKRNRNRLKNTDFTLLASNCLGGIIYHELGVRFDSPTINIRMDSPDFIRFVSDIHRYLDAELLFVETDEPFPVAILDDIKIYFVHYKTNDEAKEKWEERKKRIHWDSIYILTNDADGVTTSDLDRLKSIEYAKGIAVFSAKDYEGYDFIYKMPSQRDGKMINYMQVNKMRGLREFELHFDYVGWLNGNSL